MEFRENWTERMKQAAGTGKVPDGVKEKWKKAVMEEADTKTKSVVRILPGGRIPFGAVAFAATLLLGLGVFAAVKKTGVLELLWEDTHNMDKLEQFVISADIKGNNNWLSIEIPEYYYDGMNFLAEIQLTPQNADLPIYLYDTYLTEKEKANFPALLFYGAALFTDDENDMGMLSCTSKYGETEEGIYETLYEHYFSAFSQQRNGILKVIAGLAENAEEEIKWEELTFPLDLSLEPMEEREEGTVQDLFLDRTPQTFDEWGIRVNWVRAVQGPLHAVIDLEYEVIDQEVWETRGLNSDHFAFPFFYMTEELSAEILSPKDVSWDYWSTNTTFTNRGTIPIDIEAAQQKMKAIEDQRIQDFLAGEYHPPRKEDQILSRFINRWRVVANLVLEKDPGVIYIGAWDNETGDIPVWHEFHLLPATLEDWEGR